MQQHEDFKERLSQAPVDSVTQTAQLLLSLVRSRRFHFDDFFEGDGPYWISIGMMIDEGRGIATTLDRVMHYSDDGIETTRFILREMINRGAVRQRRVGTDEEAIYSLSPEHRAEFARFLIHQQRILNEATSR